MNNANPNRILTGFRPVVCVQALQPRHLLPLFPWLAAVFAITCGTSGTRKYPPRRPGCALAVFTSATPEIIGGWDDIGVAQATCHLDESEVACMHRLRVEACRMGGDILYSVPKRASRPMERAMVVRARVAHTISKADAKQKEEEQEKGQEKGKEPLPAPASVHEPIVPIGAPAPPQDAGTHDAAGDPKRGG